MADSNVLAYYRSKSWIVLPPDGHLSGAVLERGGGGRRRRQAEAPLLGGIDLSTNKKKC